MSSQSGIVTFLFTDIEGSTRLWEVDAERMQRALARHDEFARAAVADNGGTIVKMTGDGVHAVFPQSLAAVKAALQMQLSLATVDDATDIRLAVRCGLHMGTGEQRDNDFYGPAVNRAARIMSAAHGGQMLLSQSVAASVADRLDGLASLRDLGDTRLRDLASAERVFQLLHPSLRADFPALRSLANAPNNLPQQRTSFVGRERELAEVIALMPRCRLLTLLGPGGIGKTRLSLQAAAELVDDFADGVYFVEFAPVSDSRMVPQTVASVLGVKEEATEAIGDTLCRFVRERRMLLIFDNCEHLVHACAELADVLTAAAAGLHVVASSREALHVAGETVYGVPALTLPDATPAALTAAACAEAEAVLLFAERAAAALHGFRVTDGNVAAVVDICRRLDGIPLAIELAAACARAMPVARIAERLSDRFRLLGGSNRTSLPRQQTLRALIDWSYDLLSDRERAMLRRLAVFAGGFALEAVEAVLPADDIEAADVLPLLRGLIDKSLVVSDIDRDRYGLLETIRQYAQDRLADAGEERALRLQHVAYFVSLAQTANVALSGPEQGRWLAWLDAERENLLAAHAHCGEDAAGAEAGMRLADALKLYWFSRGLLHLGLRVTVDALSRDGAQHASALRGRLLLAAGQLTSWLGQYEASRTYLQEALSIARGAGDREMVASVLQPLALASIGLGNRDDARLFLEEALALAKAIGDRRELAVALNQVAMVERIDGRTASATEHYSQALALAREIGDDAVVAVTLLNLAMVGVMRGDPTSAAGCLRETLTIAERTGDRLAAQGALDACAGLAASLGQPSIALNFYALAQAELAELGMQRDPVDTAFLLPWMAHARDELGADAAAALEHGTRAPQAESPIAAARTWLHALPQARA